MKYRNHSAFAVIRRQLDKYGEFDEQLFPNLDGMAIRNKGWSM